MGKNKFDVLYEKLLEIAKKRNWIHELDEFEAEFKPGEPEPNQEVIQLKEENDLLKQEIENLKKLLSEKSTEHITIEEEDIFEGVSIEDITTGEDLTEEEEIEEAINKDLLRDYDIDEFNDSLLNQLI